MAQIFCFYLVVSALVTGLLAVVTRCRWRACLLWGLGLGVVLTPLSIVVVLPVVLGA